MKNYTVTQYATCKRPDVNFTVLVNDVLSLIKHGEKNLPSILEARALGKGNRKYDNIKQNKLPTFRFNFLFKARALNKNITVPTGLIYLDVDGTLAIPESNYVFAKWKSLSNTGYGVLAKVDNLTQVNYREVYNELSELIGVSADNGARSATQQTVLSFDPDLYCNTESLVYHYLEKVEEPNKEKIIEKKQVIRIGSYSKSSLSSTSEDSIAYDYTEKVANLITLEKKKKDIPANETFSVISSSDGIRFNNIKDYFTDATPYIMFEEKEKICSPYIPFNIKEGARHNTLFSYLTQIAVLNPTKGKEYIIAIGTTMNDKMPAKLPKEEVTSIIYSVLKMREEGTLKMFCNLERRFLFNPDFEFPKGEIMKIVNVENGKRKTEQTQRAIYNILEDWNFKSDGKITQMKVRDKLGCHISTIGRHWNGFKDYVGDLNVLRRL
jgi:hypothetical protein